MASNHDSAKQSFVQYEYPAGYSKDSRQRLLVICLSVALFAYFYTTFIYPTFVSKLRQIPAARRYLPLIGWGPAQFSQSRGEIFHRMSKSIDNHGLIKFQGFWDREHILLTSSEAVSEVLVKHSYDFVKPPGAKSMFDNFLGTTFLFVTEGAEHRLIKNFMQSPFNLRRIRDLYPIMWSRAMLMTESGSLSRSHDETDGVVADMDMWSHEATLDIIFRAMFGRDFADTAHRDILPRLTDIVVSPSLDVQLYFTMSAFLPHWMLRFAPASVRDHFDGASWRLRNSVKHFIEERRASARKDDSDILVQLLERGHFDDEELPGHILGILMAGIDPTTAGFTWALWYLAINPEWQTKLRKEIQNCVHPHDFTEDPIHLNLVEVLEELPVLDAVCNEALRLMPPSPTANRIAVKDTTILGHPIPAGTKLFISTYSNNRSKDYWGPSAEAFDPGRWIENQKEKPYHCKSGTATASHFAFMPFLHGPRKCIGHIYAQAEIRALLVSLVGRYEFELANKDEKVVPAGVLTSKPKHGMKLRLRRAQLDVAG